MNTACLLSSAAKAFGERPAISLGRERRLDYRALAERSATLAGALRALPGVKPGARIALVMNNRPQYLELLFAIWHAGLIAVPINARLHPKELAFILKHCEARICFVTDELAPPILSLREALPSLERVICVDEREYDTLLTSDAIAAAEVDPRAGAWVFYTSGTTGRPKGAILSHRSLIAMSISYLADVDYLTAHDAFVHLGPQSHAVGLFSLSFVAKAAHHILPASGGYDPEELIELIGHYPRLSFFLTPTMLRRLLDAPGIEEAKIDNLRSVLCGAAPVYVEDVKRAIARFGARFGIVYGQGESPCTITALPKEVLAEAATRGPKERLASVGINRTGVEVRVADAEDRELPPGEVGEVLVRGDVVMNGYWNDAEASAAALRNGWLHTGDLGFMDKDGFLTLKDRSKDVIISGGLNVYPREVEEVLLGHKAVSEVAVVGAPDPEWGERVAAFVALREGERATQSELDALCLKHIARFKRPRAYYFIDELPKNNYGKVLKTELRMRLENHKQDTAPASPNAPSR
jgi:long-chain acyl-CoA synthetase